MQTSSDFTLPTLSLFLPLFHVLTFHLIHTYNFLGFIIMCVIMKFLIFFLPYFLMSLQIVTYVCTDTYIHNEE